MPTTKPLRGYELWVKLLADQRKFIESCEKGRSYLGPNGAAIRAADEAELKRIEGRLESCRR